MLKWIKINKGLVKMYIAYKFRLYPNDEQKILIHKNFGCSRFVYNYYLTYIKEHKYLNASACIEHYVKHLKQKYPFLTEADSIIIRKTLFNLEDAFKRFFNKQSGYPIYKSKFSKNSYNTSAIYREYKGKKYCNIELDLNTRQIKLPKLKWINIKGYRNLKEIKGRIINANISKEPNGKYYVSVLYEVPSLVNDYVIPKNIIGLDLGIKKLITLSDGGTVDNNKYILKYEKRIKRLQRSLSRKVKSSKNYYKCKQQLAILYSKLKNARNHYLHNVTKQITDEYDIIITEKLQTKNMLQNKNLSKKIADASFNEIIRQLLYKSKNKGKYFYQIDTFYPSTQTCSVCGKLDKKYKNINERIYECNNCHNCIDRDLNASINIMFEGLKKFMKEEFV